MQADHATQAQNTASDPSASTWVSANAGSGKTKVLTDRVARLLLRHVPPQKILCLTYTKAAAAHMQNTLFARLGEWAMMPDQKLAEALEGLGEHATATDTKALAHARTLFAAALETPGGLKIQTIHSFCAALLRRFPLEAGVSQDFQEMDARSAKRLRAEVLESMASDTRDGVFEAMAMLLGGKDPDTFLETLIAHRQAFAEHSERSAIWKAFGLPPDFGLADLPNLPFDGSETRWMPPAIAILRQQAKTMQSLADVLEAIDPAQPGMDDLEALFDMLLLKSRPNWHQPKTASIPTRNAATALGDLLAPVQAFMDRVSQTRFAALALESAEKARTLHAFAQSFLADYTARAEALGWLDFDDLIARTRALLTKSEMAQWVLFRLDGGIDHILVDEAQDTSPEQWAVIASLAQEFFTGLSARQTERSVFVVGDEKQSIYSFQGADPVEFARMKQDFSRMLAGVNRSLATGALGFSFRSSQTVLDFVDKAVAHTSAQDAPAAMLHRAFHRDLPGRIDLWPFMETPAASDRPNWFDPVDTPLPDDPDLLLADRIATTIRAIIDGGETIPRASGDRPVREGDFLILVQRRKTLFFGIIRALKEKGLRVAGADRLKVAGELAVRDLTALLRFLLTPEDDLSLAAVLRSPLFEVTESQLFDLAHDRQGVLWAALRAKAGDHPRCVDILDDLRGQVDYLRPFELIERILTIHDGRERLLARLGAEAEDGIDALLHRALKYEQIEAPTLTGFLEWMESDESSIKRQMDTTSTEIRVMTVHGAKGLESPIVILPDTSFRKPRGAADILSLDGVPVWSVAREKMPQPMRVESEQRAAFDRAERLRLFYVAMTRAENWLIVCGSGNYSHGDGCWYDIAEQALEALRPAPLEYLGQEIRRYAPGNWHRTGTQGDERKPPAQVALPDWVSKPAPPVRPLSEVLSPSDLGHDPVAEMPSGADGAENARRRGIGIHALLERLPEIDPDDRAQRATGILESLPEFAQEPPGNAGAIIAEALNILNSARLGFLFAPDTLAEVPLTAPFGEQRITGIIDRLVITDERILAVDFKSHANPPQTADQTPEGICAQLGAYVHALEAIYPLRRIETALLWTRTGELVHISHDTVTRAFAQAVSS